VVDDQTFAPTSAPDLAQALVRLVEAGARGLVHVTNAGSCTWHGLASWAVRHEGLDVEVRPIQSGELGLAARRPAFSVLACERYNGFGLPPLRPWREALAALLHA
jgi:dTDP-4-dehydrorhamnose reductase